MSMPFKHYALSDLRRMRHDAEDGSHGWPATDVVINLIREIEALDRQLEERKVGEPLARAKKRGRG